jgi:hypothetical protein
MNKTRLVAVALFLSFSVFLPQTLLAQTNANAEAQVRASFTDMPDMITIAQCESGFRQFDAAGNVVRGSGRYIGIFQIDERTHAAKAASMAYDIYTVEGNIAYARYLYFASGTNPWKGCLKTPPAPAPTPAAPAAVNPSGQNVSGSITANLNFGMTNPQVGILQRLLNGLGFTISTSGPGSPGQETNYFGQLTREAVKRFQCGKAIVCDGNEASTGFGRVGPKTRALLNQLFGQ